jgi:hypothetical protein
MTAITGRINSTTSDVAFLRGVWLGVIGALIVVIAIVAAIWLAGQFPIPAQAPGVDLPAPVQVDEYNPVVRPGGVKVF